MSSGFLNRWALSLTMIDGVATKQNESTLCNVASSYRNVAINALNEARKAILRLLALFHGKSAERMHKKLKLEVANISLSSTATPPLKLFLINILSYSRNITDTPFSILI